MRIHTTCGAAAGGRLSRDRVFFFSPSPLLGAHGCWRAATSRRCLGASTWGSRGGAGTMDRLLDPALPDAEFVVLLEQPLQLLYTSTSTQEVR